MLGGSFILKLVSQLLTYIHNCVIIPEGVTYLYTAQEMAQLRIFDLILLCG